jgi:ferrous iron transport protein B
MITETVPLIKAETFTIAIEGNPNCGKTTLFNGLTGSNQRIGNWPGVTVERKEGSCQYRGREINVVDLPGIYSISAHSEDERIARGYVLSGDPDLVINIVDATNLERNLYLTTQLLEMKVPMIIVLNMMDLAEKKGLQIDAGHIGKHLGCPVIPISAIKKEDIEKVKEAIDKVIDKEPVTEAKVSYSNEVEDAIQELAPYLKEISKRLGADVRWTAVKLIEDDDWVVRRVISDTDLSEEKIKAIQARLEKIMGEPSDIIIADYRYGFTHGVAKDVVKKSIKKVSITERIDKIVLNRVLGIPIFLIAMYTIFWVAISFGGAFIDFFDIFFGTIFVDGFGTLLASVGSPEWLTTILAGGLGGGIQTVATFIPIIFMMFFMLSLLEDSGYMARAAFVMDRFMRWIGLPGKAFVPLLVGFGCTVPAIMATRTLENKKDRILTVLITPFMSCGARFPVYALFAAAFFAGTAQNIVFSIYMVGIALAILTGLLLKNTLFKGEPTPFVMELPPYHAPRFRHIMFHSWSRLKVFMFRAGKILVPIVIVLTFANSLGVDGSFGNEDTEKSVLSRIGKAITPVFTPIGITEKNWPASVALFTGLFAKEVVVGTLNSLYSQIDMAEIAAGEEEGFDFAGGIVEAFASIPAAFAEIGGTLSSPLGARVGEEIADEEAAAETLEIDTGVFGSMRKRFEGGPAQAYAYLLFILIYIPCVVAVAAMGREIGAGLTIFSACFLTTLAWIVSTLFYQLTVGFQAVWIIAPVALLATIITGLIIVGKISPIKA